jgi:hypothetical protein
MGSCAAPSAKGDDKFITTDYLQQCPHDSGTLWIAGPSMVGDFHPLIFTAPAHTVYIYSFNEENTMKFIPAVSEASIVKIVHRAMPAGFPSPAADYLSLN